MLVVSKEASMHKVGGIHVRLQVGGINIGSNKEKGMA